MKISAKIEYACKAVLEMALRYSADVPIQLGKISYAQGIPKKFLIQIMLRLKNANIINTARGISGGYFLGRPPSEISMGDVVKALDENILEPASRAKSNDSNRALFDIWDEINSFSQEKLKNTTFEDLANKVNKKQSNYYI